MLLAAPGSTNAPCDGGGCENLVVLSPATKLEMDRHETVRVLCTTCGFLEVIAAGDDPISIADITPEQEMELMTVYGVTPEDAQAALSRIRSFLSDEKR
jgi:hypothetical protein